jgi:hypothetical protein
MHEKKQFLTGTGREELPCLKIMFIAADRACAYD